MFGLSRVAQRQSIRLLIGRLLVRIQSREPHSPWSAGGPAITHSAVRPPERIRPGDAGTTRRKALWSSTLATMSNTPPGWYDDPNNPGEQAYWDGQEWAGPQAPDRNPGNTLAVVGIVFGAIAVLAALFGPFATPFAIAGLVIGILAALRGRKALAWVAVGLSVVGLVVSVMVTTSVLDPEIF